MMGFSFGLDRSDFYCANENIIQNIFYRSQQNCSGFILGNNVLVCQMLLSKATRVEGKRFISSGIHWESNPWPCVASAAIYC